MVSSVIEATLPAASTALAAAAVALVDALVAEAEAAEADAAAAICASSASSWACVTCDIVASLVASPAPPIPR